MRVVFTASARADLDELLSYTADNYPDLVSSVEGRIRSVIERIRQWPESARPVGDRPGVRVVPVIRYPYRIFYQVVGDRVEILHIRHTSRDMPESLLE